MKSISVFSRGRAPRTQNRKQIKQTAKPVLMSNSSCQLTLHGLKICGFLDCESVCAPLNDLKPPGQYMLLGFEDMSVLSHAALFCRRTGCSQATLNRSYANLIFTSQRKNIQLCLQDIVCWRKKTSCASSPCHYLSVLVGMFLLPDCCTVLPYSLLKGDGGKSWEVWEYLLGN